MIHAQIREYGGIVVAYCGQRVAVADSTRSWQKVTCPTCLDLRTDYKAVRLVAKEAERLGR